jgi:hypothetical protein
MMNYQALMARKVLKCSTCVHYRGSSVRKPMCNLFKFQNHIDNDVVYFADTDYCRNLEMLCGPYAKYHEFNEEYEIKEK